MRLSLLLSVALCVAAAAGEGVYGPDSPVVEVTPLTFNELVFDTEDLWLLTFHAPGCKPCMKMAAELESLVEELAGYNIHIGHMDSEAYPEYAARFHVTTIPAIKVFREAPQVNPYTRTNFRGSYDYSGPRTAKAIRKFAFAAMGSWVDVVPSDADWPKTRDEAFAADHPLVVVVSAKDKVNPMVKRLSADFHNRGVDFAQISPSLEKAMQEAYGVETIFVEEEEEVEDEDNGGRQLAVTVPAVLVVRKGEAPAAFEGDLKDLAELSAWVEGFALAEPPKAASLSGSVALTTDTFQRLVQLRPDVWVVHFLRDGKAPVAGWDEAVAKLESVGMIRGGTVDCEVYGVVCDGVDAPFQVYSHGENKRALPAASLAAAQRKAIELLPDRVQRVSPELIDNLLVQGQQESKIVALWVTEDSNEEPPELKTVALAFEESVLVAVVSHPTEAFMQRFQIQRVPLLLNLWGNLNEETGEVQFSVLAYEEAAMGAWNFQNVAGFFYTMLQQVNPESLRGAEGAATDGSAGVVVQLTEENYAAVCGSTGKLCAVALLSGAESEETLAQQRDILQGVADREGVSRSSPFSFTWADGLCQQGFAGSFDVTPDKLPTMVIYSPKKERYAPFLGVYEEGKLREFLRGVLSGSIHTSPPFSAPALDDGIDCTSIYADFVAPTEIEVPAEEEDFMAELMAELAAEEEAKEAEKAAAAKAARQEKKKNKGKKKGQKGAKKKSKKGAT